MPYREKVAWLSLMAMVVAFGPYFVIVSLGVVQLDGLPNAPQLQLFAAVAVTQVTILGAGHLHLRRASPIDARMPLDERDRTIMQRSMTAAYYVLITGMCLVGVVMPFNKGGWSIIHAAIFMIVLAEVVHYAVVVFSYRRHA